MVGIGRLVEIIFIIIFHVAICGIEEHSLCSMWWLVNDLKIDLQMGRFDLGVADLPPDS